MESPRTLVQPQHPGGRPEDGGRPEPFRARRAPAQEALAAGELGSEQLVLERYRLLERLGAGGFGVVWRARDELLQREVAVKRIWLGEAAGPGGDPSFAERAAREAQAAARLSHPAIVALYEACPVGDAFYLISELVHGQTLGRLIAGGELEDRQTLAIGVALADALEHAHSRGVIHRDIKPQNVLVPHRPEAPRGRRHLAAAKLTDFGGASLVDEDVLTRTGDVLGTLAYMAPEQSAGKEAAEPADLYSLALVLYEALSGVNPVRGATPAETARRIGTRLEPLARRRRDLPRELTHALDRALAPRARERGTIEDLRSALQEAQAGEGEQRTRRRPPPLTGVREGRGPALPSRRRRPRPAAGLHERHEPAGAEAVQAAQWPHLREGLSPPDQQAPAAAAAAGGPGLPRLAWLAPAFALAAWQGISGRPGVALLALAALLPAALIPSAPYGRLSALLPAAVLAPLLGVAGLAGAFPALAGQPRRGRERFVLGALGYWWLTLAEPLLGRRLWLGPPAQTPPHGVWEASLQQSAAHVVAPAFATGVLLGALLWGGAALVLPLLVRGRNAALDVLAAVVWSAALAAAAPRLDAGLAATALVPSPRGAVIGACLGGLLAVGARALRGPVGRT